jgi:hypothetical protein
MRFGTLVAGCCIFQIFKKYQLYLFVCDYKQPIRVLATIIQTIMFQETVVDRCCLASSSFVEMMVSCHPEEGLPGYSTSSLRHLSFGPARQTSQSFWLYRLLESLVAGFIWGVGVGEQLRGHTHLGSVGLGGLSFANQRILWFEKPLMEIIKATRATIQSFSEGRALADLPESCSIKVPGCPEWIPHLDRAREGSFQVVIALTDTTFLVWPGSHRHPIGRDHFKKGFYPLSKDDLGLLEREGCTKLSIPASAGDVLVMLGGLCVHSSPAVLETESERIATYAHWVPKEE